MPDTKQVNTRLPALTLAQIEALAAQSGMTVTQVIIVAIDRMAQAELPRASEEKS